MKNNNKLKFQLTTKIYIYTVLFLNTCVIYSFIQSTVVLLLSISNSQVTVETFSYRLKSG